MQTCENLLSVDRVGVPETFEGASSLFCVFTELEKVAFHVPSFPAGGCYSN